MPRPTLGLGKQFYMKLPVELEKYYLNKAQQAFLPLGAYLRMVLYEAMVNDMRRQAELTEAKKPVRAKAKGT